jgi:hypothetical protein
VEVTRVPNHCISDLYGLKRKQAHADAVAQTDTGPEAEAKKAKKASRGEDNAYYQVLVKVRASM